jgi:hypothetical protein
MEQWAISSEASLETEKNVQRLLKLPKVFLFINKEDYEMENMEGVNRSKRRRGYGARDKEELINAINSLL